MINDNFDQNPLIYKYGILGFRGYINTNDFICVFANGDNHFLQYGIAEKSLLVIDPTQPFEENKLNVFLTNKIINGRKQHKLSLTNLADLPYVGRVIMSLNQYC